jgi:hypothetical protein
MSHQTLVVRNLGVETVSTALSDHLALCQRVNLEASLLRGRGLRKLNTEPLEIQLSETMFIGSGQVEDCWKENTRTWLHGGRSVSDGKSASFSSKKGLRGLEKI